MPRPERTALIISIMSWLDGKTKLKRPPRPLEAKRYIELEICEMGATTRTISKYLHRLQVHGLVKLEGGKLVVTGKGKEWLSIHTQ